MLTPDWKLRPPQFKRLINPKGALQDFSSCESGAMTILTLALIVIIFVASGFAVDVMRYDRERAKLQYALDRAVLAAADLDQELCPKEVVKNYLEKEGLDKYLVGEPIVEPDICGSTNATLEGYRRVEASAQMDIEMHFMKWRGIETIASAANSVAEEAIGNVEISLVLDVSGSMRGSKLTNLKTAANKFIDDMLSKSEDGKVSISIVPYSEQVSIPSNLIDKLNTEGSNRFANCLDFTSADFATTSFTAFDVTDPVSGTVTPGTTVARTLHFTDSQSGDRRPDNGFVYSTTCLPNTSTSHREITIMQKDPDILKQEINLMQASGWTSIDVGLKWGLALLDESFRPLTKQLVTEGAVPAEFNKRPAKNRDPDTMKVVILMTDGANTKQHMVNPPYNTGTSDIWWNESRKKYSVYDRDAGNFVWLGVAKRQWNKQKGWYWVRELRQDHAFGEGTYKQYKCNYYANGKCQDIDYSVWREKNEGTGAEELSWPEVWERTPKNDIYNLLKSAMGRTFADDWYNRSSTELDRPQKDPRVTSLCQKAKDEYIHIFPIAFDAPSSVKPMLKGCVTHDGAYYEATDDNANDIISVFASIGYTIQNLRLTQ